MKPDNSAVIGKKASRLLGQTGLRPVEQPGRLFDVTAEDGRLPKSYVSTLRCLCRCDHYFI